MVYYVLFLPYVVRISSLYHILAPSSIRALTCASCNKASGGEHVYIYIYIYGEEKKKKLQLDVTIFFETSAI